MGSRVVNLLREEERKARLRFWKMLAMVDLRQSPNCPFCKNEPPPGAILLGVMPKYLRSTFIRAYNLRSAERQAEAEVYEEALNDLLQEHFKKILKDRQAQGESPIRNFVLSRNWSVYAIPL
jgi:hypothetical protein